MGREQHLVSRRELQPKPPAPEAPRIVPGRRKPRTQTRQPIREQQRTNHRARLSHDGVDRNAPPRGVEPPLQQHPTRSMPSLWVAVTRNQHTVGPVASVRLLRGQRCPRRLEPPERHGQQCLLRNAGEGSRQQFRANGIGDVLGDPVPARRGDQHASTCLPTPSPQPRAPGSCGRLRPHSTQPADPEEKL